MALHCRHSVVSLFLNYQSIIIVNLACGYVVLVEIAATALEVVIRYNSVEFLILLVNISSTFPN